MHTADIDVVKDIPGYKVILKAVLRSQIQQLVEQLAAHTDEESVILTANVSDGTLGHLGSETGKHFLDGHDDMKSQFLGFCLKKHHTKQTEARNAAAKQAAKPPAKVPASLSRAPHLSVRHEPYARNRPAKKPTPALKTSSEGTPSLSLSDTLKMTNEMVKRETEEASESDSGTYGVDAMKSQRSSSAQSPRSVTDADDSSEEIHKDYGDENQSFQSSEGHEASNSKDASGVSIKAEDRPEFDMDMSGGGMPGSAGSQDTWGGPEGMMGFDTSGATGNQSDMPGEAGGFNAPEGMVSLTQYRRRRGPIPKIHPCRYCSKIFKKKHDLIRHERIHTGEKPYSCEECGKHYRRKYLLDMHNARIHSDLNAVFAQTHGDQTGNMENPENPEGMGGDPGDPSDPDAGLSHDDIDRIYGQIPGVYGDLLKQAAAAGKKGEEDDEDDEDEEDEDKDAEGHGKVKARKP